MINYVVKKKNIKNCIVPKMDYRGRKIKMKCTRMKNYVQGNEAKNNTKSK